MKHSRNGFAFLVALVLLSSPAQADIFMVIVGIDEYRSLPPLRFAERDALAIRDAFTQYLGVRSQNMKVLLGENASYENVGSALRDWLPDRATGDDLAIFYFSGRSTRVKGGTGEDVDEAICLWDADIQALSALLRRDMLDQWLSGVPSRRRLVILDSSVSGDASGSIYLGENAEKSANADLSRLEELTAAQGTEEFEPRARNAQASSADTGLVRFVASQPKKTALELAAFQHGAFTYFFLEGVRRSVGRPGGAVILGKLRDYIRLRMREYQIAQEPIGTGSGFESFTIAPTRGPTDVRAPLAPERVISAIGDRIALNIGRAHGVRVGATYFVIPAKLSLTGRDAHTNVQQSNLLKVVRVEETTSTATFAGDPFPVTPNDPIRLFRMPIRPAPLTVRVMFASTLPRTSVELDRTFALAVRGELARSPITETVHSTESADVKMVTLLERLRDGRYRAQIQLVDGFSLVGAAPVKQVITASEVSAAAEDLVARLRPALDAAATRKLFKALDNPFSTLKVRVEGPTHAAVGENVTLRVEPSQDCYLLIVDVASDGSLYVIFPNAFAGYRKVRAGEILTFPDPTKWSMTVGGPDGIDVIKVIATRDPLPFLPKIENMSRDGLYALSATESQRLLRKLAYDVLSVTSVTDWSVGSLTLAVGDGWSAGPSALSKDPIELNALE